jgi:hypothetical protein
MSEYEGRVPRTFPPCSVYLNVTSLVFILIMIVFHFCHASFSSQIKSKIGNILAKVEALRINLNIDGTPIASRSHTHPSHSQTSRLLTSSLSLGVPVPHRNGTLDRGLDTQHGCVCYHQDDRALPLLVPPLLQFKFLSFVKEKRYRNSSLLFPYFKKKETKGYVTSPRVWTCDFLFPFYVISLPHGTQCL